MTDRSEEENDYSWVTNEMFDEKLEQIVGHMPPEELLSIDGIYEILREELNNAVLDALEAERGE